MIFYSDRNGSLDIFKQDIDQSSAEPLVTGPEDEVALGLSPDGAWLHYVSSPRGGDLSAPKRLMRVPVSGGPAQLMFITTDVNWNLWCARAPSNFCAYADNSKKPMVFYAFDPVAGKKGREIFRVENGNNFDVFPDGRVAVLLDDPRQGRVRIIRPTGETEREFTVEGWSAINHIWCSADNKGLYLTSSPFLAATLLYVDLHGKASVLWQPKGADDTWGVPSPDGRYLAIMSPTLTTGAWLIENF